MYVTLFLPQVTRTAPPFSSMSFKLCARIMHTIPNEVKFRNTFVIGHSVSFVSLYLPTSEKQVQFDWSKSNTESDNSFIHRFWLDEIMDLL